MVTESLIEFVEKKIIPLYSTFDKGHGIAHARKVIEESLKLAEHYDTCKDMVYAIAAFHDTGLCKNRETHHIESGRIIRNHAELREWFNEEQIEIMAEAAEDHRASSGNEPRSIYGKIVAEADRDINPERILRRTVQYGQSYYPELDKEGHWKRFVDHMHEKYAEGGYLRLWIPYSDNAEKLALLRALINDEARLRWEFERIWSEEASDLKIKA